MRPLMGIVAASFLLLVAGCSPQPPSVATAKDVQRLDPSTWSLAARELPDEAIASLARLRALRILDFAHGHKAYPAKITDAGVAELAKLDLPVLETLTLGQCKNITDRGLRYVGQMQQITMLRLNSCPGITDAGLRELVGLKNVTYLDLRDCPNITDDGIQQLATKKNWEWILLGLCPQVTAAGVAKLRAALPDARVEKDDQDAAYDGR